MSAIGQAIFNHIQQNMTAILASAGILFVAVVSCMPPDPPSSLRDYWHWVRESLQTAIPAARRNHDQNPTPPADPAKK